MALLSGLLSLALLEIAVRIFLPRPAFVAFPVAETRGIMKPDPVRGYAYAPEMQRHVVTPDYEIDFSTNALGMRDAEPDRVPATALPLLAVGDSYTQGHGVELAESWPKQLQAKLRDAYVYNAGVSAYGMTEIRKTALHFMPRFAPKTLFVGVFVNGFPRIEDPFVVVGDGAGLVQRSMADRVIAVEDGYMLPTFSNPRVQSLTFLVDRYWRFGSHVLHLSLDRGFDPGPLGRDRLAAQLQPMLDELERLSDDCARARTPMVALLINSAAEPDGHFDPVRGTRNELVLEFARANGLCLVDPFPAFARSKLGVGLRLGSDPHWSRDAHRIAADEIAATLEAARGTTSPCAEAANVVLR